MICYDRTIFGQDTSIENLRVQKILNIEKITSKVAQMKSLMSLHPLIFFPHFLDIFTVRNYLHGIWCLL